MEASLPPTQHSGRVIPSIALRANKVFASKREARQMVAQGGLYVNDVAVTDAMQKLSKDLFVDGGVLLRKGKKKYYRLVLNK